MLANTTSWLKKLGTFAGNLTGYRFTDIQHIPGSHLLGQLPAFYQENGEGIIDLLLRIHNEMESRKIDRCVFWLGSKPVLVLANPGLIENFKMYNEKELVRGIPLLDGFLGNTILNEPEDEWKIERKIIKDLVHNQNSLNSLFPSIIDIAKKHIENAKEKDVIDFKNFFSSYVLDVFISSFMGLPDCDAEQIQGFVDLLNELTATVFQFRSVFKFMLPSWIRNVFYYGEQNDLSQIRDTMKVRFTELLKNHDNGSLLVALNEMFYKSKEINVAEQFGRLLFLISAGSATTAGTLQFAVTMLAAHSEVKEKLKAELKDVNVENLSPEAINEEKLPYLHRFLNEVWRLFPPTPFYLPRENATAFTLHAEDKSNGKLIDIDVEAGDVIMASPFLIGRSSRHYDDPNTFNPSRFDNPDLLKPKPFSSGIRQCPGYKLAKLEIIIMLIHLLKTADFNLENIVENSTEIDLTFRGSMMPKMDLHGQIFNPGLNSHLASRKWN